MTAAQPGRLLDSGPGRGELNELRLEVERLRAFVEIRAQAQENLVRAMVEDTGRRAAEALEGRIQLATREAMAFAEQGLSQHEAALRALGRRVAELARDEAAEPPGAGAPDAGLFAIGAGAGEWRDCRALDVGDPAAPGYLSALAHLPILPGGAAKLAAAHVVEYAPLDALAEKILPHWRSRLAPGGELVVVTLDGPAWAAELARASGFEALRQALGADGRRAPVRHLLDAEGLVRLLGAAGFAVETPTTRGVELRVAARLPAL